MPKVSKKKTSSSAIASLKRLKERVVVASTAYYQKATAFIKRKPLESFGALLVALLLVLILGSVLKPEVIEEKPKESIKAVEVYRIGESPKATFQAKIEKSGVVKIIAQTPGVVQSVAVTQGQKVSQGQQIVSLSSNYQGGNASSVQRQIAQTQYQNLLDTYDQQRDLIDKQRKVADETEANADKLRDISHESANDTNALIDTNQKQLDDMEKQLATLESNGGDAATIATLKSSISQLKGGIIQLRSSQRSIDYQGKDDTAATKLGTLQKDITKQQLDVQEKSLATNKEINRLQVSLAYISESMMAPASPFAGTVERIYVREGELVNPGTVIATVTSTDLKATAVLSIPEQIATILAQGEPSELLIGGKTVAATPYYVSSQATDGQMYSVFYDIPQETQSKVTHGQYISVNVPVSTTKVSETEPFIPVDAVYQTQESSSVLVATKDKAQAKEVTLGKVFGSYVEVLSGLTSGDRVILNRNVVAGDKVTIR